MPYNITIDHTNTAHSSDHSDHSDHSSSSSATDDEDSTGTGVQVPPRSAVEGHEYSDPVEEQDGSWNVVYPDEIGPSDSASRPRTSNQQRPFVEAPRPEEARRSSFRRHISREPARHIPHSRAHRSPPSEPPESVDSNEEWQGYARGPPQPYSRPYIHYAPGYPSPHAYQAYPGPSAMSGGQQQMVPYGFSPYQTSTGGPASYFAHGHHGAPSHEMIPHAQSAAYFPYAPQGYQMPMSMPLSPPVVYPPYNSMYAHPAAPAAPAAPAVPAAPPVTTPPPPPSTSDTSKEDEKFLRLEKLFLEQKAEQKAEQREREAAIEKAAVEKAAKAEADAIIAGEIAKAIEKAAKEKAAKAEADAMKAEDIAKASAAAAAAAKEEVKKEHQAAADEKAAKAEADAKKAEEIATASAAAAAAAKAEVEKEHQAAAEAAKEKAAAAAAADAAAAAAAKPSPPPKEKDKPIKFKDAIGRRFNFPFDVCNTWSGMEYLIKEAFLHVADLGPHVADGHYDLLGPKDEIIMPSIWESVVEPGWEITMHMWPIPEPPPGPPAGPIDEIVIVEPGLPPPPPSGKNGDEKRGKKKSQTIPPFMIWTAGKSKKGRGTAKGKKK